jgi:hypothetical protein
MADSILKHLEELPRGAEMAKAIRGARVDEPWHTVGHELELCGGFPGAAFCELNAVKCFCPEFALNFAFVYFMASGASIDLYAARFLVSLDLVQRTRTLLIPDNYPDPNWCLNFDSALQHALSDPSILRRQKLR